MPCQTAAMDEEGRERGKGGIGRRRAEQLDGVGGECRAGGGCQVSQAWVGGVVGGGCAAAKRASSFAPPPQAEAEQREQRRPSLGEGGVAMGSSGLRRQWVPGLSAPPVLCPFPAPIFVVSSAAASIPAAVPLGVSAPITWTLAKYLPPLFFFGHAACTTRGSLILFRLWTASSQLATLH